MDIWWDKKRILLPYPNKKNSITILNTMHYKQSVGFRVCIEFIVDEDNKAKENVEKPNKHKKSTK
jgi:hypothetical protein